MSSSAPRTGPVPWLWFLVGGVEGFEKVVGREDVKFFGHSAKGGRSWCHGTATALSNAWAEIACREKAFEVVRRHRTEIPAFARAHICRLATQLGVTESRRLTGEHVVTSEEASHVFPDVIGRTGNWTRYKEFYDIPSRALLPKEFDNLLVAGRCISVDHKVHHSTKEIPCCFVTGQAAGTAAALALRAGVSPKRLDVRALQGKLVAQGAFLGEGTGQRP